MKKRDVIVVIQNYIQYVNVKSVIDELINLNYKIDIYCPKTDDKTGLQDMFDDINSFLKKQNYNVIENYMNFKYKVLLEPYPYINPNVDYKIIYRYSNLCAKPNIVYLPERFLLYDAILCSGEYDSNYLSVFSKTYKTGNIKYENFKKRKNLKDKKTLLYLPTYGDCSSIEGVATKLSKLRKKYHVIAKIHHGTNFLKDEKDRIKILKSNVDEFYDSYKDLNELLSITDVVLTDNSGSIFDALYTNIPVAVFCDDINKNKIGNFDTIQFELYKKGILPYTNDANKILNIVETAQTNEIRELQNQWSKKNFYYPKDLKKDFVDVVINYINDNIDKRYYEFHKILSNDYYKMKDTINMLEEKINNKEVTISKLKEDNIRIINRLNEFEKGKLYKLSTKLYSILSKIRRIK